MGTNVDMQCTLGNACKQFFHILKSDINQFARFSDVVRGYKR